jgi:hypothetical protein
VIVESVLAENLTHREYVLLQNALPRFPGLVTYLGINISAPSHASPPRESAISAAFLHMSCPTSALPTIAERLLPSNLQIVEGVSLSTHKILA